MTGRPLASSRFGLMLTITIAALAALAALAAVASEVRAETVSLTASPASSVDMTVNVSGIFGSDSDGPATATVTGTAEASFSTVVDPTLGGVASSLQITAADLALSDTSFSLVVTIPIDISIEGARVTFSNDVLAPGIPVAAGTSDFDLLPLQLLYTAGELVVIGPPGIPLDNTYLDLMGQATVEIVENGGLLDVTVTIPIQNTTTTTDSGITVELVTDGVIVLEGSTSLAAPVPGLGAGALAFLGIGMLVTGYLLAAADPVRGRRAIR